MRERLAAVMGHGAAPRSSQVRKENAMRRIRVVVALGAMLGMFGGVVTASPALAGRGHKWEVFPAPPAATFPAAFCGFKVRVTTPVDKEFIKVLKAADGSMTFIFTGSFRHSYTNLSTGKTITENASASSKFTGHADDSVTAVSRGRNSSFLTPADAKRFGLPTISILTGRLTLSFDANGNITSLSLKGHVLVDVCAALS